MLRVSTVRINTRTKSILGSKGLFQLTAYRTSLREGRTGVEAGTEAETVEKCGIYIV